MDSPRSDQAIVDLERTHSPPWSDEAAQVPDENASHNSHRPAAFQAPAPWDLLRRARLTIAGFARAVGTRLLGIANVPNERAEIEVDAEMEEQARTNQQEADFAEFDAWHTDRMEQQALASASHHPPPAVVRAPPLTPRVSRQRAMHRGLLHEGVRATRRHLLCTGLLKEEVIAKVEVTHLPGDQPDCPICCEPFKMPVRTARCGHVFCAVCITTWLSLSRQCPYCRQRLLVVDWSGMDSDDESEDSSAGEDSSGDEEEEWSDFSGAEDDWSDDGGGSDESDENDESDGSDESDESDGSAESDGSDDEEEELESEDHEVSPLEEVPVSDEAPGPDDAPKPTDDEINFYIHEMLPSYID